MTEISPKTVIASLELGLDEAISDFENEDPGYEEVSAIPTLLLGMAKMAMAVLDSYYGGLEKYPEAVKGELRRLGDKFKKVMKLAMEPSVYVINVDEGEASDPNRFKTFQNAGALFMLTEITEESS